MLHKCVKAAVLRAAFPEEGLDYAAEEMDGHETEGGGHHRLTEHQRDDA